MPAKLPQLDVLRTLQSQRSSVRDANAEKPQLSRALPQRPYRLLPPILPGTFSFRVQKVLQHLCLRFTQVAPYFIIQLFDLLSRHAENLAPLLASCRIQYTNCFLFLLISPLFTLKFQIPYRVPMIWLDVFPSILCIPRHFAAFSTASASQAILRYDTFWPAQQTQSSNIF
ncbi:CNT_collapsed_G0034660.mRNA.1.CDS.1 [Saccharomyces cerevisiae]|nr:CNT_collapsed_G0034660.mRNA.1.CDS.1 [Saccharomyces cerevisiae]